ncbi:MAG TPA: DinB family protein [Chitinophagales bacterium]|nr:DinB family protein [Chitinophagales bacterium]
MKELLTSMTAYNVWANRKLVDALMALPVDMLDAEVGGSFNSIRKTIYHIWDAQVIWLSRLQGASPTDWPSKSITDDFSGFDLYFLQQSEDFNRFVETRQETFFDDMCFYRNLNGDTMKTRNGEIILHCMNHSTYHRGQIISYMRQAGITELPHTDFIVFTRERN